MADLRLRVLSLRYSSWSIRPWLALTHAGAEFATETVEVASLSRQTRDADAMKAEIDADDLGSRRKKGSVTGLFPVLWVGETPIHEALAIAEWTAENYPEAGLWPSGSLDRARARSVSSEMAAGFPNIRGDLSCHVFARVPDFSLRPETRREVERVFEIWGELLDRHRGPFLTGGFGIVDCMYFPVVTRFRTYGVSLPTRLEDYARRVEASPPALAWRELAREAPRLPVYDDHIRGLGGDPDGALG